MTGFKGFMFGLLAAMVAVGALFVFGKPLETKFFPVYSKFEILSIEPYGVEQSRAVFQFTKYRECDPQGFSWYAGDPAAAFRQIGIRREGVSDSGGPRPLGTQQSSPFIIDATPDQLRGIVFAEIYSRCHFLWTTRTDIYP